MKNFKKIEYNDLREEIALGKFPKLVGRYEELERFSRVINRSINNNLMIVGPSGVGKTMLAYGWMKKFYDTERYKEFGFIQFDAEHLYDFESNSEEGLYFKDVMDKLPESIIFIDNFGRCVNNNKTLMNNTARLYNSILKNSKTRVVLTLLPHEYAFIEREFPAFLKLFETIKLKKQNKMEIIHILENKLASLNKNHGLFVSFDAFSEVVSYIERFPVLGELPQSAISLLDESIVLAKTNNKKSLDEESIASVVSSRVGIPTSKLNRNEIEVLKTLKENLNSKIINQESSIEKITNTLKRAKLGIRNPNKPLGSFLILGPSGVGKTETAKMIAEIMFGKSESFIRFDMSEFGQDHTVQRLIGAPAGYSGYEDGGALTNALSRDPHSLVLLDEIEKAHPKIFDIFLQVLDDGRLTSGQNETVDARSTIIMATSNIGVDEILKCYNEGIDINNDKFIEEKIIPELAKTFRLEFINRFDSILVFNPLDLKSLITIAMLEVKKIQERLSKHKVEFDIDRDTLTEKIKTLTDPRFGARPVKRFIEETCESLLVNTLLK